jgi:hypothetical protein
MASIYGQAALMISATAAENCHSGILNDRHVHYSPALGREKNRYLRQHLLRWDLGYSVLAAGYTRLGYPREDPSPTHPTLYRAPDDLGMCLGMGF